ncbi:MAG: ATP-binding protein [Flavobacteriaceae bacterium]
MALTSGNPFSRSPRRRLALALLVALAICMLAIGWGGIGPVPALLGLCVMAAALVYAARPQGNARRDTASAGTLMQRVERDVVIVGLLGAFPEPVILLDGYANVHTINPAASRIFSGLEKGRPITPYMRAPELGEALDRVTGGGGSETVAFTERFPVERWLEVTVSPLGARGAAGRPEMVMLAIRDLTPAQRLERMRADFVANASHELRTPLASLTGFIETLQGPARDDPKARDKFLATMAEQARRMARLIDDLLSLSRIELKAHVQPETEIDLVPVVRHVVDALQPIAAANGVEIRASLASEPLHMLADRDEITQVFQNIVENAVKYGREGRYVDVSLTAGGSPKRPEAIVTVRDYGPGISAEHLPRLTERFYRVDVAQSRETGGTGLGLAIVKHILNRHRCTLKVDSREGEGATFSIRLPLESSQASIA